MNEQLLRRALLEAPLPSQHEAERRAWRIVGAAFRRRAAAPQPRLRPRVALAVAVGLLVLVLVLTPAGAKVADLVEDLVQPGEERPRPALTSLPAPGRLLVTSARGPWIVASDGSKRLLGSYQDATWSPHGLFVAATRGRELTAVEPDGTVRWSRASRRPVSHPAWSPSGFRIAYLAGHSLRVVAGDGTGDHLLDRRISPVAPAWKATPPASPAPREIVSYVDADGRVRTIDADSGRKLWRTGSFLTPVRSVEWSPDGSRLLVVTGSFFTVLGDRGQAIAKGAATGGGPGALSPDGRRIAIVRRSPGTAAARSRLVLSGGHRERRLYAGLGRFGDLAWSPNGEWLLLTWSDADQWLFIRPADDRVMAVAEISRQFAPGGRGRVPFPHLAGWCCAPIP